MWRLTCHSVCSTGTAAGVSLSNHSSLGKLWISAFFFPPSRPGLTLNPASLPTGPSPAILWHLSLKNTPQSRFNALHLPPSLLVMAETSSFCHLISSWSQVSFVQINLSHFMPTIWVLAVSKSLQRCRSAHSMCTLLWRHHWGWMINTHRAWTNMCCHPSGVLESLAYFYSDRTNVYIPTVIFLVLNATVLCIMTQQTL